MTTHTRNPPMSPARPAKAAITGKQLRAILERKRYSQGEAARILGVSRVTVVRWLNGSTPISAANANYIKTMLV